MITVLLHECCLFSNKKLNVRDSGDVPKEQPTLKNVNNCLKTNIFSYLETSGGKSYNLYFNVVHFFNTSDN